jgi:nitroreductase
MDVIEMDLFETIINRRSIRSYRDQEVSDEILLKLTEMAHWAPSAGNINPRCYLSVKDTEMIERIKSLSPGMFGNPAAIMVLSADKAKAEEKASTNGDIYSIIDVAMAAQNMLLAAHALGLGACVIRSFHAEAISNLLGFPGHIVPELLIVLGYPEGDPPRGIRPDLKEAYHQESF